MALKHLYQVTLTDKEAVFVGCCISLAVCALSTTPEAQETFNRVATAVEDGLNHGVFKVSEINSASKKFETLCKRVNIDAGFTS